MTNSPYLLYLFVLLLLNGCQTTKSRKWTAEDIIISDQASFSYPQTLSSKQAEEDIDFLIFAISNGYGGSKYTPGNSFTKAISALKKISDVSNIEQFHEKLDETLFLIPDNHLLAYYKGKPSKKRLAHQKTGHVGKNSIRNSEKIWEVRTDQVGNKKILYVAITRFPDKQSNIWNGFIDSISSHLNLSDTIVIDLRGNTGGDDAKGMELAQILFGHPFEHPIKHQYRSQAPATLALAINRLKVDFINMKYDGLTAPDYLTDELNELKELYHNASNGQLPKEFIRTDKGVGSRSEPVTGFKKPIYILMDGACGSSCEFTIAAFEWHDYVKKVGENTNGTFHFGNTGIAVLPHSKIKVMIPTQFSEYYDGRFIERIGLTPDIKVPPGDDAYEFTKRIIRKMARDNK